jgi:hypothetical protein
MEIFCIDEFKTEFDRLISKKAYHQLEQDIIDYFFNKSDSELCSGTRLNNSDTTPYIKKRLNGRGGFRTYFLLIKIKSCIYLMFVHPKTGSLGAENISDESKAYLYKKVLACIQSNNLYKVELNSEKRLVFNKKLS